MVASQALDSPAGIAVVRMPSVGHLPTRFGHVAGSGGRGLGARTSLRYGSPVHCDDRGLPSSHTHDGLKGFRVF